MGVADAETPPCAVAFGGGCSSRVITGGAYDRRDGTDDVLPMPSRTTCPRPAPSGTPQDNTEALPLLAPYTHPGTDDAVLLDPIRLTDKLEMGRDGDTPTADSVSEPSIELPDVGSSSDGCAPIHLGDS